MRRISLFLSAVIISLGLTSSSAQILTPCFTPGEDCTGVIVAAIQEAAPQSDLLVQAYYLTSRPIIDALKSAKDRGVNVQIIVDKTMQQGNNRSILDELTKRGIEVRIDPQHIAHNKVMIIAGQTVITGSFNFTASAQNRNVENVLVIKEAKELADRYIANWHSRNSVSRKYEPLAQQPKAPLPLPAKCFPAEPEAQQTCPDKRVVWNSMTRTKVYHCKGGKWFANTKSGCYMCEPDALMQGLRAASNGNCGPAQQ